MPHRGQLRLRRVAFSMSNAIGDSLVCMVIVHNLIASGVDVSVFGGPAHQLAAWFPSAHILPLPHDSLIEETFARFDAVFQMHHEQPVSRLLERHHHVITLHNVEYGNQEGCMGERFAQYCRDELGINNATRRNGMTAPNGLVHRRHANRVIIHPEASTGEKRWLRTRFIEVAATLKARGFEVVFIIAPHERERWDDLLHWGIVAPNIHDLDKLAGYVYESGWFIGNDSGIGHLASSLGIPSVIVFRRRNVSEKWRPAWGDIEVVLPWQWMPSAYLKEKWWRETLTCARVLAGFDAIVRRHIQLSRQAERSLDRRPKAYARLRAT
ncbi:glycosyltransferase family 9 protein [Caballeronia sordidicola]|uniref:ADP-heptose:LPS heptosyltransferase n=1 Tax=Caballeronia sordidicola TaxID=196367 RepID=A0A242M7I3_CABSO|nr:glycosyltransferase family 9 protein [Caballeronia sordidicola]OTP66585.1 hypothetical protein PAMC26577_37485 [Caballeronia sordidicola]